MEHSLHLTQRRKATAKGGVVRLKRHAARVFRVLKGRRAGKATTAVANVKKPRVGGGARKRHRPHELNAAVVESAVYPTLVRETMGVEAALAMRTIVTAMTGRDTVVAKQSTIYTRMRSDSSYAFTAMWLANALHYGLDECVTLLKTLASVGYIVETYRFESDEFGSSYPVDFDVSHTIVYRLESALCIVDADAPLGNTGLPRGKAMAVSLPKELAVFVAGKRALRMEHGVVQAMERRGLVRLT